MEAKQHASEQQTYHGRYKKRIKICIETNENENTTTQNLWDSVKVVLRGKVHCNTSLPQKTRQKSNK